MTQVLIVEPDVQLAATYASAMRSHRHSVQTATTAQAAILAADAATPDVVLLELQLTAHSGIEFLYEFRSYVDWRSVPVIIHSNVPPSEFANSHKLLFGHLGVTAYHYKPDTSLRTLLYAVENVLAATEKAG